MKPREGLVSDVKTNLLPDIMKFSNICYLKTNETLKP